MPTSQGYENQVRSHTQFLPPLQPSTRQRTFLPLAMDSGMSEAHSSTNRPLWTTCYAGRWEPSRTSEDTCLQATQSPLPELQPRWLCWLPFCTWTQQAHPSLGALLAVPSARDRSPALKPPAGLVGIFSSQLKKCLPRTFLRWRCSKTWWCLHNCILNSPYSSTCTF